MNKSQKSGPHTSTWVSNLIFFLAGLGLGMVLFYMYQSQHITPPSVPENNVMRIDSPSWGSYTNTALGFTLMNFQEEGYHVERDTIDGLGAYDETATTIGIGIERSVNPRFLQLTSGLAASVPLCGTNLTNHPNLSFKERIELLPLIHPIVATHEEGRRSKIVPITLGTRTGYGFVTRGGWIACAGTEALIDREDVTVNESTHLFFENKAGNWIYITYPRESRMAQAIMSTFRFID